MSALLQPGAALPPAHTRRNEDRNGFFRHHGPWAPGVRLFRRLGFRTKAVIVSLVFLLPLLALLSWDSFDATRRDLRFRHDAIREHVEIAHRVLTWAHAQESSGKLSRVQAQQMAREAIKGMRYSGSEYFWINDMQARIVMHPIKPELEGQDGSEIKDPNGLALFKAFVAKVQQEQKGFVEYQWPKPGEAKPVDKVSYVMGFAPWGWVLGSGVYVNDVLNEAYFRWILNAGVAWSVIGLGAYFFYCFYLVMDGGLKETRRHLRAMTEGDLTTSPYPWGRDEAAQLMLALREMQDSLRSVVAGVREGSHEIVRSSTEIAHGAVDLSARTEQAAASLQESAAAMDQMAASVKQTAEHVHSAAHIAGHNAQIATRGGEVIGQMVLTMEDIHGASSQISDITGVIDGIAFQTNILALNAAVEAARAGESGRGFAVVASEVRALAQRSAGAAREIKTLISTSVDKIEAGTGIVREAGLAIEEIVTSAQKVNDLLAEIATGSREQSQGIGQIGQAIQELDRTTQQNAALVEQTAGAAGTMKTQADTLAAEVARFKTP